MLQNCEPQSRPHSPQFLGSDCVSTSLPAQSTGLPMAPVDTGVAPTRHCLASKHSPFFPKTRSSR